MIIEVDTAFHRLLECAPCRPVQNAAARRKSLPEVDHTARQSLAWFEQSVIPCHAAFFPHPAPRHAGRARFRYPAFTLSVGPVSAAPPGINQNRDFLVEPVNAVTDDAPP